MVTKTACLIFHGVDCLPDLIEVNRWVFVNNASVGGPR
jgi:hypothetical protein